MEPDLYWQCDCGHTNVTAPSAFKPSGSATHVCSECEQPSQLTRADCTTERRVPVEAQLPPDGTIIGGEPGVEYVFAPTHDSGAMWEVDGVPVPTVKVFPTETRGRYATATVYRCNSKECGALSLKDALFDGLCACGASVSEVHDVSKDQFRRLSAAGDEIVALVRENERLAKERDEARAEVERLATVTHGLGVAKEAVEQHNEELRAEVEALTGKVRLLEAGRDERDARILSLSNCALGLRAEVERLKEERLGVERALQTSHDNLDERWSELSEAHSRIAALEAVIEAQGEQAVAMSRNFHATLKAQEALNAVGLDAKVTLTSNCIEETP